MPYVRRDVMGRIESVHRASATDAVEYLDPSHPELKAFLRDEFGAAEDPAASLGLLRVLEEVLGLFLAKGLLNVDELSHDAQVAWSSVLEARSPPNALSSMISTKPDAEKFGAGCDAWASIALLQATWASCDSSSTLSSPLARNRRSTSSSTRSSSMEPGGVSAGPNS